MKHVATTRAWRPDAPRAPSRTGAIGLYSALLFNLCLLALPLAAAKAVDIVVHNQLYDYSYSEGAAHDVRQRVERLSSTLVTVGFDRRRQWDDMVAMELMKRDVAAARGFLLSGPAMLPGGDANRMRARGKDDASLELAGMDLLEPATRARYESLVPLLSRRAASGVAVRHETPPNLGGPRDFELLANAMVAGANPDTMHFVLTGLSLGLGGEFTPRMAAGAAALLAASRRDDYPPTFSEDIITQINSALSADSFRAAALQRAGRGVDPSSYPVSSMAFHNSLDEAGVAATKATLDQIGQMSEATSPAGAALLLTHARNLNDLPRLNLIAKSAGDRAVAAAKNLPRDGRLVSAARGTLAFTKQLSAQFFLVALAFLGLGVSAFATGYQFWQERHWRPRYGGDDDHHDLVHTFRGDTTWRPL